MGILPKLQRRLNPDGHSRLADIEIDADYAFEQRKAPAIGAYRMFFHGPLVMDSLVLKRESDGFTYTNGVHYIELAEGGLENLTIPQGTVLTAEYYYVGDTPVGEPDVSIVNPVPPGTPTTQAGTGNRVRVAALLKWGM